MKVVATSDFHGRRPPDVPTCDLLLIAGDVLAGDISEFAVWLRRQPARNIVGVAGNHDYMAQRHPDYVRALPWTYLHNEAVTLGGVTIWGSPLSMPFGGWAFMAPEDELEAVWTTIPEETNVVVVHGPAWGILDLARGDVLTGSRTLRKRLLELPNLRLLVTGHIHEAYGQQHVLTSFDGAGVATGFTAVNASWVDENYEPGNPPIVLDFDEQWVREEAA